MREGLAGYNPRMDETTTPAYKTITPEEVAQKLARREDVYVVDVRTPREYRARHLPDAILLPTDEFADRYARELDPEDEVILVCERGLSSEAAARYLASQGFTNVATMAGGMLRYDGPVETGS